MRLGHAALELFLAMFAFVIALLNLHRPLSARLLIIICLVATMLLMPQLLQRFQEGIGNLRGDTSASLDPLADQQSSVGFRRLIWGFSLEAFQASPVWGLGRQGFEERRRQFVESGQVLHSRQALFLVTHAHNQYLQELVMRGLLGLGALLLLWLGHLQAGRRLARQSPWAGYAMLSVVSAFMIFGLSEVALKHDEKIYTYLLSLAFLYLLAPATQGRACRAAGGDRESAHPSRQAAARQHV